MKSITESQPPEPQSVNTPPWAWTKAVNSVLSNPPFDEPDDMPVLVSSRNWLYLSDEFNSIRQIDKMLMKGVTHVLSMNIRPGQWQTTIQERLAKCNIVHMSIAAKDNEGYDLIGKHWESEAKPFLLDAKNHPNGKIVVHCAAGTNRSGRFLGVDAD
ncbi:MAG: hypothetical protein SGBAC_002954 [Bacillariaceae sp.]